MRIFAEKDFAQTKSGCWIKKIRDLLEMPPLGVSSNPARIQNGLGGNLKHPNLPN
jgi:hypothetical protein